MDMKCTARLIKLTPGPGDYENIMAKDSAVVKKSHNYIFNNYGGIPKATAQQTRKDFLVRAALDLQRRSQPTTRIVSGKPRVMSGLSRRSAQMYGSKAALNNQEGDKIRDHVIHKGVTNMATMNNSAGFSETPIVGGVVRQQYQSIKGHNDAVSDSMGQSVTKYSKNPETDVETSVNNPAFFQRDLSVPRGPGNGAHKKMQYSTDFTKTGRRKKLVQGAGQQLDINVNSGYETENL